MDTNSTAGTGGGLTQTASNNPDLQGTSGGNDQLSQAFDRAIAEAQRTLATSTVKGADLYALKQSVR